MAQHTALPLRQLPLHQLPQHTALPLRQLAQPQEMALPLHQLPQHTALPLRQLCLFRISAQMQMQMKHLCWLRMQFGLVTAFPCS